jgi:hypothetical protein|tara:strand:- start:1548 stop:1910 length:363 start_codon:yes stop_codon:yes gene_type:complete
MIIQFSDPINFSVQVGDLAWYVPTSSSGVPGNKYSTGQTASGAQLMGEITDINRTILPYHINVPSIVNIPFAQDFIMFSKNNKANLTSVLGYYADITMINRAKGKIELFSVASEIAESSK